MSSSSLSSLPPSPDIQDSQLLTPGQKSPTRGSNDRHNSGKSTEDGASSSSSSLDSGIRNQRRRTAGGSQTNASGTHTKPSSRQSLTGISLPASNGSLGPQNAWTSGSQTLSDQLKKAKEQSRKEFLKECTVTLRFFGKVGNPAYLEMLDELNIPHSECLAIGPKEEGGKYIVYQIVLKSKDLKINLLSNDYRDFRGGKVKIRPLVGKPELYVDIMWYPFYASNEPLVKKLEEFGSVKIMPQKGIPGMPAGIFSMTRTFQLDLHDHFIAEDVPLYLDIDDEDDSELSHRVLVNMSNLKRCHKCQDKGHVVRNCPDGDCTNCGSSRHTTGSCPNPVKPKPSLENDAIKETGHLNRSDSDNAETPDNSPAAPADEEGEKKSAGNITNKSQDGGSTVNVPGAPSDGAQEQKPSEPSPGAGQSMKESATVDADQDGNISEKPPQMALPSEPEHKVSDFSDSRSLQNGSQVTSDNSIDVLNTSMSTEHSSGDEEEEGDDMDLSSPGKLIIDSDRPDTSDEEEWSTVPAKQPPVKKPKLGLATKRGAQWEDARLSHKQQELAAKLPKPRHPTDNEGISHKSRVQFKSGENPTKGKGGRPKNS